MHIYSLSLPITDFNSTQQKLSSVFTIESDCPERIWTNGTFRQLTGGEINADLETVSPWVHKNWPPRSGVFRQKVSASESQSLLYAINIF